MSSRSDDVFDPKESKIYKYFQKHHGKVYKFDDLLKIAHCLMFMVDKDNEAITLENTRTREENKEWKIERPDKRNKKGLYKWFDRNYSILEPYLPKICYALEGNVVGEERDGIDMKDPDIVYLDSYLDLMKLNDPKLKSLDQILNAVMEEINIRDPKPVLPEDAKLDEITLCSWVDKNLGADFFHKKSKRTSEGRNKKIKHIYS